MPLKFAIENKMPWQPVAARTACNRDRPKCTKGDTKMTTTSQHETTQMQAKGGVSAKSCHRQTPGAYPGMTPTKMKMPRHYIQHWLKPQVSTQQDHRNDKQWCWRPASFLGAQFEKNMPQRNAAASSCIWSSWSEIHRRFALHHRWHKTIANKTKRFVSFGYIMI